MTVKGRFLFVDALRGVAASAVLLYHLVEGRHIEGLMHAAPHWLSFIIEHGNLGVAIFFVLSGFVIAHSLYSERITVSFAGRFMLRRSLRLDPPYWVTLALTIAFGFLSARVLANKAVPEFSTPQMIAHIFYLQDMLGYQDINLVFWTLCMEVQFYLVYVTLLVVGRREPILLLGAAMLISLLWPVGIIRNELFPGLFLPLWHGFLLGVGAYWTWRNPQLGPLFAVFTMIVAVSAAYRENAFSLVCAVTAIVLWMSATSGQIFTALPWRWLQFLGAISYSVYLTHTFITGASFRVGYMLTGDSLLWEIVWSLITVAACIAFAAAMWWLVEKPSTRLARQVQMRATTSRTKAPPPLAAQPLAALHDDRHLQ